MEKRHSVRVLELFSIIMALRVVYEAKLWSSFETDKYWVNIFKLGHHIFLFEIKKIAQFTTSDRFYLKYRLAIIVEVYKK